MSAPKTQPIPLPQEYEQRVVAFLDILGWRELVNRSQTDHSLIATLGATLMTLRLSHELSPSLETQLRVRAEADGQTFDPADGRLQFSQFSDSMVLSGTKDLAISMLLKISGTLRGLFYGQGLVIRGAVTSGYMFHRGSVAFGPALTSAYDLEQGLADVPRVIVDPKLFAPYKPDSDAKSPSPFSKMFRRSSDGFWFFDYLYPLLFDPLIFSTPPDRSDTLNQYAIPHLTYSRKLISDRLAESSPGSRKEHKYKWMAGYLNEVLEEFKDANVAQIEIE